MKIRIKFAKSGVMKFIGHLDMMRYFQKAMRRADIDIKYSEGFSPHQIMSFAAPLGVGITSDGEYLDIEVNSTASTKETIANLNNTMVDGVKILEYKKLPDHAKNAMSIVAAADYKIYLKDGYDSPYSAETWRDHLKAFFYDRAEVLITKKTKKSEKVMNLKELIYDFKILEEQGRPVFYLNVCTGSNDNLKPELVLQAFYDFLSLDYQEFAFQIHRVDVYAKDETGSFIPLGALGEDISKDIPSETAVLDGQEVPV